MGLRQNTTNQKAAAGGKPKNKMIELLIQYVDSGSILSEYQVNKLIENKNLLIKYLRKRTIAVQNNDFWTDYEKEIIINGIKNNLFNENLLIDFVKSDYDLIYIQYIMGYIENPSEQVKLAAVKQNGNAINAIKNPSEDIQLAAVKQYGISINYIKNPSEDVKLAAVKKDGLAIMYIKNPSEQVKLAAVKQNGNAISFIENPSEQVQLAAVKQNGYAIKYVKNPSEQVQLAAVKQDGEAIQYIENPYPSVINYVKSKK